MPAIADNALVKAATPDRADRRRTGPSRRSSRRSRRSSARVLGEVPSPGEVVARARGVAPYRRRAGRAAARADVLADDDLARRGSGTSFPRSARSIVDCRLLPGQTPEEIEPTSVRGARRGRRLRPRVPGGGGRHAVAARHAALVCGRVVRRRASSPAPRRYPSSAAGFTDSHWLREAFGTVAYGFFPYRTMAPELAATLIHSADERVPVVRSRARGRLAPARRRTPSAR